MNWAHFTTFVWLRWRLMANQVRRAGAVNAAITTIVVVSLVITAIPLFIGGFFLATYLIPKAAPAHLMYAWDVLLAVFLLFWMIGLLTELQRNDPLSLSKFLHLPVSVTGAFLINYLSSLVRLSLVFFGPLMIAFALALVYVKGKEQLAVLPALAAFLLMITAPTYQFQGWLGSLMSNPRRRRSVVVGFSMAFVLVVQLPNLLNLLVITPKITEGQTARSQALLAEMNKLTRSIQAREVDPKEVPRIQKEIQDKYAAEGERATRSEIARWEGIVRVANTVVPLGWLPVGVISSAEGSMAPAWLGVLGMTLIGSASLAMAYRSTVRQFQGQSSNRKVQPAAVMVREPGDRQPRGQMLEARLPGLSEPVSAIALGNFRSLLRAPEAKISLLMPLIMGAIFGSILLKNGQAMPASVRPIFGIGAIGFVLFGMLQLMGNQFGSDRDGFRVFVLCAAPRRNILLGKNLSYVPSAVVLSAILVIGVLVLCPMRFDHALSMAPQFVSMYLLFCAMANLFSIASPIYMAPGTLKAANPKMSTVLLQLLMFLVLFPLVMGLTLIPLGVEAALNAWGVTGGLPVCLLLSLAEAALIVLFYYFSLGWMGNWLQSREQKILETVTNRGA